MAAGCLSRLRADADGAEPALAGLLRPHPPGVRAAAGQRLLRQIFGLPTGAARNFLWREERPGQLLVLSPEAPVRRPSGFEVETRAFEPRLMAGDMLAFVLRANISVDRRTGDGRLERHDLVTDARRAATAAAAGDGPGAPADSLVEWLRARGEQDGFTPRSCTVTWRERWRIPRGAEAAATIGVSNLKGILQVTEPERFVTKLLSGYGRARAYGCGLLLVRRI